mgnify:CR=1 FL=1
MTELRLEGAVELQKVLKALPRELAKRALASAARAGGVVIRKAVQARAPVLTGGLKASVTVRRSLARKGSDTVVSYRVAAGGPEGFHALFHELGSSHESPKPFMRPAAEEAFPKAVAKIRDALRRSLAAAAKKVSGRYGGARRALTR